MRKCLVVRVGFLPACPRTALDARPSNASSTQGSHIFNVDHKNSWPQRHVMCSHPPSFSMYTVHRGQRLTSSEELGENLFSWAAHWCSHTKHITVSKPRYPRPMQFDRGQSTCHSSGNKELFWRWNRLSRSSASLRVLGQTSNTIRWGTDLPQLGSRHRTRSCLSALHTGSCSSHHCSQQDLQAPCSHADCHFPASTSHTKRGPLSSWHTGHGSGEAHAHMSQLQ